MTTKDVLFWVYPDNFEVNFKLSHETDSKQDFPFTQREMNRKKLLIQKIETYQGRNHLRRAIERKAMLIGRINRIKTKAEALLEIINQELEYFN